jgi:ABC-type branched-subunit amino acid transport system permease subunit
MLGFPVLRLRGDYLAIVTLAFGEIIRARAASTGSSCHQRPARASRHSATTFFGLPFTRQRRAASPTFFGLELRRRSPD